MPFHTPTAHLQAHSQARPKTIALVLLSVLLCTACGYKGALFLPKDTSTQTNASQSNAPQAVPPTTTP